VGGVTLVYVCGDCPSRYLNIYLFAFPSPLFLHLLHILMGVSALCWCVLLEPNTEKRSRKEDQKDVASAPANTTAAEAEDEVHSQDQKSKASSKASFKDGGAGGSSTASSGKQSQDEGQSQAASATTPATGNITSKGTYPRPKNFAERIMNVLENEVDPDVIRWLGEKDLISINTRLVKSTDILATRFQGIRYAAFVRNLSRWYVLFFEE